MKNQKKLTRDQLRTISGGDETDKLYGGGNCHCHGLPPSQKLPNGLPPIDIYSDSPQQCYNAC
ncbi:bacteriocin-like protein [Chryseobacterium taichungense]|nr:hypothetical protein [Chryseobacterium taichungense]